MSYFEEYFGLYAVTPSHEVVRCDNATWSAQLSDIASRRVARTEIREGLEVSTVFLGIDHSFGMGGPPLLFETMVWRDGQGEECWRESTWNEAEARHAEVVAELREVVS